jgi:gliding motility-associated-like protein
MRPITTLICIFFSFVSLAQTFQIPLNQGRLTGASTIVETPQKLLTYSNVVLPPAIFGAGKLGNLTTLSPLKGLVWSKDYQLPKTAFPLDLAVYQDGYLWSGYVFDNARTLFLSRMDKDGKVLWSNQYGTTGSIDTVNQGAVQAIGLKDGNIILAGGPGAFANDLRVNDLLLIKIDQNGGQIWSKRFCFSCGGNVETVFGGVTEAPDGGFLITASMIEQTANGQKILLIKTDASGTTQWVRSYFDAGSAVFQSDENGIQANYLPNGNIVLMANQGDLFANSGGIVAEVKPNGDLIRSLRLRINPDALFTLRLNRLLVEGNNRFTIAAGVTQDSTPDVSVEKNLLFQINFDGNIPWQHNYNDEVLQGFVTADSDVVPKTGGGYAYITNDAEGLDELFQVLVLTDEIGGTGCELPTQISVETNFVLTQETKSVTQTNGDVPVAFPLIETAFAYNIDLPTVCFPKDTVFCRPDTLTLAVMGTNLDTYLWSTGANSPEIQVTEPGQYVITVRNTALCFEAIDTITIQEIADCQPVVIDTVMFGIPNAFAPNSDASNDTFRPIGQNFTIVSMQIYNRWGGLIYEDSGANAAWNGRVGDQDAPVDTYVYVLQLVEGGRQKQYVGDVTLLR